MSAVLELPVPTRSRWSQVPAVLAAVAGPLAWRLLWPLAVWLVAAGVAWVSLAGRNPYDGGHVDTFGRWSTLPSGILLLAGFAAIPVLWVWGARYAAGLGHDRAVVFAVTTAASVLLQAALHVVSLAAGLLELRALGTGGIHVFALETSNIMGTHDGLWNGSWVFALWYLTPVILTVLLTSVGFLRLGPLGLLLVLAIPAVLIGAAFVTVLVDTGFTWFGVLLYLGVLAGSIAGAWAMFRCVAL